MKGYRNIVEKEIVKHKKRSILTILVIMLGVSGLIFLSEIDFLTCRYNMQFNKYEFGDKHFTLRNIENSDISKARNNALVKKTGISGTKKVDILKGDFKGKEDIFFADELYFKDILKDEFYLLEGRVPKNSKEALIIERDIAPNIGEKIKVDGQDVVVVGTIKDTVSRDGARDRILLGFDESINKNINLSIYLESDKEIVKKAEDIGNALGITKKMHWFGNDRDSLLKEKSIDLNIQRINLQGEKVVLDGAIYKDSNEMSGVLITLMTVSLIFLTYISINAAVKEKKKMYSTLKCIGASNGQVRSLILKESIVLAALAVVPGIILGEIIYLVLKPKMLFILGNANISLNYVFSLGLILKVVILVCLVCILASLKPMIWMTKLTPIEGVCDENILGTKKRIKSKFIGKLFGYETEIAYKNLRGSGGGFFGFVIVLILTLIVFNVFTSYYKYQIDTVEQSFGVLDRDLSVIDYDDKALNVVEEFKEYGDYSKIFNINNVFKIKGIEENVLKDSKNFLYLDKERNEVVSKDSALIAVINDKAFNDLMPYIKGDNLTLEKFKNSGAILFSNQEKGALNKPKNNHKIEVTLTDLDQYKTKFIPNGNEVSNKEIFNPKNIDKLDLNLLGTIYFETLLGPTTSYSWDFIGLVISEDTAKKINRKYEAGGKVLRFEFNSEENREKHMSLLEGRIKGRAGSDDYRNRIQNTYEMQKSDRAFMEVFASVMYTILGYVIIMMLLCTINIRDIILNARKKEFGIMFAVGMDKSMLRKSLMIEGVMQGLIALVIGNGISILALNSIKKIDIKFVYSNWIIILGSLIIVGILIITTINAIKRLKSDRPIELIKNIE